MSQNPSFPLVSCTMPTCNRRRFISRAILYFLRQDYPNKELFIVDDGEEEIADLIPDHPEVRYVKIPHTMTLGEKRNFCVLQSKGNLIMHWDDDDWMAPNRISYQVKELLANRVSVCGIQQMYFHEVKSGRSYLYRYPQSIGKPWLAGGSLLYTRKFWSQAPFPKIQVASDTPFIMNRKMERYLILEDYNFYIATIHDKNTSPKRTNNSVWNPIPTERLQSLLQDDWEPFLHPEMVGKIMMKQDREEDRPPSNPPNPEDIASLEGEATETEPPETISEAPKEALKEAKPTSSESVTPLPAPSEASKPETKKPIIPKKKPASKSQDVAPREAQPVSKKKPASKAQDVAPKKVQPAAKPKKEAVPKAKKAAPPKEVAKPEVQTPPRIPEEKVAPPKEVAKPEVQTPPHIPEEKAAPPAPPILNPIILEPAPHVKVYEWENPGKVSVGVLITTFQRAELLDNLIQQIQRETGQFHVFCVVVDDEVLKNRKRLYWRTVNALWEQAKNLDVDYYIQMPDDMHLEEGFIQRAVDAWNHLQDPRKMCLNLLLEGHNVGKPTWTDTWAELRVFDGHRYMKTQWVNMFYICTRAFYNRLDWRLSSVPLRRWSRNPNLSSGVGSQVSKRLSGKGDALYQVTERLASHVGDTSKMSPSIEQKLHPSIHLPKIIAGMATIPDRAHILKEAIHSIIHQVDTLYLFFNDFEELPEWVADYEKIVPFLSKQEQTNMGDAGKFYGLDKMLDEDAYFFSLDDDCIYPQNYVWLMIEKIEQYNRKAVVGCGGYLMKDKVSHFYSDRSANWHIQSPNKDDRAVHILHTNLTAWHHSTIRFSYADCELPNMGDLWLGIVAQKQEVPMVLIERPAQWVKIQDLPLEKTIYGQHKNNDAAQTKVFNSLPSWKIPPLRPD
ncbi:MAG: glycosyltransferase [Bacteroidota bacterium]